MDNPAKGEEKPSGPVALFDSTKGVPCLSVAGFSMLHGALRSHVAPLRLGRDELAGGMVAMTQMCLSVVKGKLRVQGTDEDKQKGKFRDITVKDTSGWKLPKKAEDENAVLCTLMDAQVASAAIIEWRSKLMSAATGICTHTSKIPDARTNNGESVFAADAAETGDALTSRAFKASRSLSSVGNAALIPAMRFLSLAVSVDGVSLSVGSVLGWGSQNEVDALLSDLNEPAREVLKEVGAVLRCRARDSIPDTVDSDNKTVLVPTPGGGYVSVSPLYNLILGGEMEMRIGARMFCENPLEREFISTRTVLVGGSKPQNCGALASDVSGRLRRLKSMPMPVAEDTPDRAAALFRVGRLGFFAGAIRRSTLDRLVSALRRRQRSDNAASAAAVAQGLRSVVFDMLRPFRQLSRSDVGELDVKTLTARQVDFAKLSGLVDAPLSDRSITAMARELVEAALPRLSSHTEKLPDVPHITGTDVNIETLRDVAAGVIKEQASR